MADEQKTQTAPEYEYVEAPENDAIEYEYVEVPEGEVPPPAADGEQYEYEYVEAPADAAAQPADENVEYEYVEAPAPEAEEQYEYVEVPENEAAQYEYAEIPETEAQPAGEEHYEYEYVEAPAEQAEQKPEEYSVDDLFDEEEPVTEPPLPPETEETVPAAVPELEADEPPAQTAEAPAPEAVEPTPEPPALESESPEPAAALPEVPESPEASVEELEAVAPDAVPAAVEPSEQNAPTVAELETLEETPEPAAGAPAAETPSETAPAEENTTEIDALAAEEVELESAPAEPEIAEETQEAEQPSDADDSLPATGAVSFDGRAGVTTVVGSDVQNTVVLTNDDGAFNRLADWHLIVNDVSVSQLSGQAGQTVALNEDAYNSGILITADGEQHLFANAGEITIPAVEPDECTLILNSSLVMSLAGRENSVIELNGANGMLVGPDESKLYFSGLASLTVPAVNHAAAAEESPAPAAAPSNAPVSFVVGREAEQTTAGFVFTAQSGEASTTDSVIVVKAGYSLYGWNVVFKSGLTMSLADVRTYQTKHDVLPEADGQITYKNARLTFTGASRIKVFEQPSYCGYGKAPE